MTPAELAAAVRDAVPDERCRGRVRRAGSRRGRRRASEGFPPRRLRHQRRVAPGQGRRPPGPRGRRTDRRAAQPDAGHRTHRRRRAGLPEHHPRLGRAGRDREVDRRRRPRVRPLRRAGRPAAQPGVRLREPHRPGAHRCGALGRRRRRRWPGCCRPPAPTSPGSTTSTTPAARSSGSPAPCGRSPTAARCPRTATPAATSRRSPPRSSPQHPDVLGARPRTTRPRCSANTASS